MPKAYYNAESYSAHKSIGHLVRRGRTLLTSGIQSVFENHPLGKDITFAQYVVLMCLRDRIATRSTELCQYICYDTGAFTRLLDQMEERKWIKRKRSTEDRRIVDITLTAAGRNAVNSLVPLVVNFYNEVLEDFTHEEADQLVLLLTRLVKKLSPTKEEKR